jgi:hypothetical protein
MIQIKENLPGACPVKYVEDVERSEFDRGNLQTKKSADYADSID